MGNWFFLFIPFLLPFIALEWMEKQETICLYKNITGRKCFGCGITKSIIALTQLNFSKSFYYNNLIIIVGPLLIYAWIKNLLKLSK